jgi:hypothetical protein
LSQNILGKRAFRGRPVTGDHKPTQACRAEDVEGARVSTEVRREAHGVKVPETPSSSGQIKSLDRLPAFDEAE